jgi:hypothetical protein
MLFLAMTTFSALTNKLPTIFFDMNGIVTDIDNIPLLDVSAQVKGTSLRSTTTDLNGRHALEMVKGSTLIFSIVGYEALEVEKVQVGTVNAVQVVSSQIDDVVVVAFGTQKMKELIGSTTLVTPSGLKVPSSNLTTAFARRITGMIAYKRSGEPSADNTDFFIRGVTTFGYKKDPLILIDGAKFSTTDIVRLRVNDVSSVSTMKYAAALYGAQRANDIILVTTKQGKEGSGKMSFRVENSISTLTGNVGLVDLASYMRLYNEAVNRGTWEKPCIRV